MLFRRAVHRLATTLVVAAAVLAAVTAHATVLTDEEKAMLANRKQQQHVTAWLSKRYRVAGDAANMFVATAYLTARDIKLDPLLILAVMAIESGLNPFAESPVGAQGLMQVMTRVHVDKYESAGGTLAAFDPVTNMRVGVKVLQECIARAGSLEAGLRYYVGAANLDDDSGYAGKVLAEHERLRLVASGRALPIAPSAARSQPIPIVAPAKPEVAPPQKVALLADDS